MSDQLGQEQPVAWRYSMQPSGVSLATFLGDVQVDGTTMIVPGIGYNSLADLAASTILIEAPSVQVNGYYAAGDGGGGVYVPSAAPAGPGKVQTAHGQWWVLAVQPYYVDMFGAGKPGSADDAPFINQALAFVGATGGGTVNAYAKTYPVNSPLLPAHHAVTLNGMGCESGNAGVGAAGATVFSVGACDFLAPTVALANLTLSNFYVFSANVGAGYMFNVIALLNNLRIVHVQVEGMLGAIHVSAAGGLVCPSIEDCQFGYNLGPHVSYANGATVDVVAFTRTRFEQNKNGNGHFTSIGVGQAIGSHVFLSCVFEAASAVYGVDLGANFDVANFTNCHFEDNATGQANGADVFVGSGSCNVFFQGCNFSYPNVGATGFYNIRTGFTPGIHIQAAANNIVGMGRAGYAGFIYCPITAGVGPILIGNQYNVQGSPFIDYLAGAPGCIRIGDGQERAIRN